MVKNLLRNPQQIFYHTLVSTKLLIFSLVPDYNGYPFDINYLGSGDPIGITFTSMGGRPLVVEFSSYLNSLGAPGWSVTYNMTTLCSNAAISGASGTFSDDNGLTLPYSPGVNCSWLLQANSSFDYASSSRLSHSFATE